MTVLNICFTVILLLHGAIVCYDIIPPGLCKLFLDRIDYCYNLLLNRISIVLSQNGCTAQFDIYLEKKGYKGGMAQLRLEFCTNVFFESASYVQQVNKQINPILQDLFMEQSMYINALGTICNDSS